MLLICKMLNSSHICNDSEVYYRSIRPKRPFQARFGAIMRGEGERGRGGEGERGGNLLGEHSFHCKHYKKGFLILYYKAKHCISRFCCLRGPVIITATPKTMMSTP